MSDPLRHDPSAAGDAGSEPDRDIKIEQLLLDGLDEDFAGRYEQAINIWTRALFFDRHHPRARAYIERARAALAERQRESEELLDHGVAAFNRGEGVAARRLLEDAIERGAPADEALAVLGRLTRIEQGSTLPAAAVPAVQPDVSGRSRVVAATLRSGSAAPLWFGVGALAAAVAIGLTTLAQPTWWPWTSIDATTPSLAPPRVEAALPVPRRAEQALARARQLAASGHLYDALVVLDAVGPTDAERADADRLRADVQRQLLALAAGSLAPPTPPLP